jgi:hypothetical protein
VTRRVAWVQIAWTDPLFWRWFLVRMVVTTLPALLCFHWRAGLLGLGALALGAFPWPVRITLDARGITLTSLLIRARWGAETLEWVALEVDTRLYAWPRRPVLLIQRRGRPVTRVFGSATRLAELAQAAGSLGFS